MDEQLERLVAAVVESAKYRHVSPVLVRRVGARELAVRRSWREAVKGTKSKLHQVGAAYLTGKLDYGRSWTALQAAAKPWLVSLTISLTRG